MCTVTHFLLLLCNCDVKTGWGEKHARRWEAPPQPARSSCPAPSAEMAAPSRSHADGAPAGRSPTAPGVSVISSQWSKAQAPSSAKANGIRGHREFATPGQSRAPIALHREAGLGVPGPWEPRKPPPPELGRLGATLQKSSASAGDSDCGGGVLQDGRGQRGQRGQPGGAGPSAACSVLQATVQAETVA